MHKNPLLDQKQLLLFRFRLIVLSSQALLYLNYDHQN